MTRPIEMESIAILGAGLTGLSLGAALNNRGMNFKVFEAKDCVGGLARTLKTDEFRWDLGVHALYSKDTNFIQQIKKIPIDYQECRRNVKICYSVGDSIYPLAYPFENGLSDLPPNDLEACLEGYRIARAQNSNKSYKHLEDWIENGLGVGFSRIFMIPYNRKIWNAPLSEISMDLVSGKIEPETYEKVLSYAKGEKSEGRRYQARFIYPKHGIQDLCNYFALGCGGRIFVGMKVVGVRETADGFALRFENGHEQIGFTKIISTIPLKRFIGCLPYPKLYPYTSELHHNNTVFVMVGLKSGANFDNFAENHWSFYAGNEIFYRLTMMHTFSNLFPKACVAEYTVHNSAAPDLDYIAEMTVKDLIRRKILLSKLDVKTVKTYYEPFTYPIPTIHLKKSKKFIQNFLAKREIYLLGRNGNWDYINMDQVLVNVQNFVEKLMSRI